MADNPKVVSIRCGGKLPAAGESSEAAVAYLEGLLERAKNGEAVGVAVVECDPRTACTFHVVGYYCGSYSMLGAAQAMVHEMAGLATENDD